MKRQKKIFAKFLQMFAEILQRLKCFYNQLIYKAEINSSQLGYSEPLGNTFFKRRV